MAEFTIIEKYFTELGSDHKETLLSVGDDAAVVEVPEGFELAISVDTMTEGIHFMKGLSPELIAHKILTVNLSDMAAMGAKPRWATLAMGLDSHEEEWLERFSTTLNKTAKAYGVQIIGGDTTEGPLVLTLTIMGILPKGMRMTRCGAKVGDKVFCSGVVGDAALALTKLLGEQALDDDLFAQVLPALHMPAPQVTLGQRLLGQVNSCIDISDGLIGDCEHIANRSNVSINIELRDVPLSPAYRRYIEQGGFMRYAVAGGDDYQLLFTISEEKAEVLNTISKDLDISLTEIGSVVARDDELVRLFDDGKPTTMKLKSFQHFS